MAWLEEEEEEEEEGCGHNELSSRDIVLSR